MATEFVSVPAPLMLKLKEAAQREEITVEQLVQDALERRLNRNTLSHLLAIGDRNARRTGAQPQDVETEIAAHRAECPL